MPSHDIYYRVVHYGLIVALMLLGVARFFKSVYTVSYSCHYTQSKVLVRWSDRFRNPLPENLCDVGGVQQFLFQSHPLHAAIRYTTAEVKK